MNSKMTQLKKEFFSIMISHRLCSKKKNKNLKQLDVRVGLWRKLSAEELMLLNCSVGEDSWGSLGLQGDPTSPF